MFWKSQNFFLDSYVFCIYISSFRDMLLSFMSDIIDVPTAKLLNKFLGIVKNTTLYLQIFF